MKKINIIKKNQEYEQIINKKNNTRNEYFSIYISSNNLNIQRFGIAVPKKIGIAVTRNKMRRILKNIIDKNKIFISGIDYIIIVNKRCLELKYLDLEKKLIDIINKISDKEIIKK